jgi:ferric-dicitrate binding protein FerR (iron transport regulator)
VKVGSPEGQDYILTKGKGVRLYASNTTPDTFDVAEQSIHWTEGESSFQNAPLVEVINELIIQFNVLFDIHQVDLNRRYTGKFLHSDLKTALSMVFGPMGIQYELVESNNKVILK